MVDTGVKWQCLGGKTVDVMPDHGVNGPVLSPRGMFLKQVVAWLSKGGSNFTCLYICYGVLKLLGGKWPTVNDPLSTADKLKRCPLNGRVKELNCTLLEEMRILFTHRVKNCTRVIWKSVTLLTITFWLVFFIVLQNISLYHCFTHQMNSNKINVTCKTRS